MKTLDRKTTLIPSIITLRVKDNRISIQYRIVDDLSRADLGDTFINFEPSDALMEAFKVEIEKAINKK